ncbi:MAG: hypothetical protein QOJ65_1464, partial [Fimbriimonadaceae bacterium]|nr:hypothetical protein [Fimbriimonadaceae bacterium]
MAWDEILSAAALPTAATAVMLGGAVGQFRVFVPDEGDMRQRVNFHREVLVARVGSSLTSLLRTSLIDADQVSRIASEYCGQVLKIAYVLGQMDGVCQTVRICNDFTLGTSALALLLVLFAASWKETRSIVALLLLVILVLQ